MDGETNTPTVRPMPAYFREWRDWAGLTQEELADRMGMSNANLSRYETGVYAWKKSFLEKFATAVGCPNPWDPIVGPPGNLSKAMFLMTQLKPDVLDQVVQLAQVLNTPRVTS